MMLSKFLIVLISIAVIARFIWLDYAPPHLSNDEIGAAYGAYSISKTLKDGSDEFLPLLWSSHGGQGSPLAIYIPLVSIALLGNNDFAVRLPSAVLGSLTVVLIGFLVMELTRNTKLSLVTSFLLAFSPWHFSASRRALESNYALFFIVLGLYLFFIGANRNKNWAILASVVALAMSIYSYYTEWVLTPLIIFSLIIFYRERIFKKKIYMVAILLLGALLLPLFLDFLTSLKSSRASSEFITQDIGVGRLLSEHSNPIEKGQIILKAIIDKYSTYNSLDYLFFFGANILPKYNPYQFGFFLAPLLIPFVWGLFRLKEFFGEHTKLVYGLLIISPLAASLTLGEINNWRSLPQLLPVSIITAAGVFSLWKLIRKSLWMKTLGLGSLIISLFYFCLSYFIHFPLESAEGYQYGYKQVAEYINVHYLDYERIIVDPRFGSKEYYYIGVPSSYIPFYTYLDPRKMHEAKVIPFGITLDKYEFREVSWDAERVQKNYLYVVPSDNAPDPSINLKVVHEIPLPNKKIEFKLYSL